MTSRMDFNYNNKNYAVNLENADSSVEQPLTINGKKYKISVSSSSEISPLVQTLINGLKAHSFESIKDFEATLSGLNSQEERVASVYESVINLDPISQNMKQKIDAVFQNAALTENFRGSALIVRGGKTLLNKGYGIANEQGEQITGKTIFHLGSVSKQFTAAAILLLEQQGLLDTQDPIKNHLPAHLYNPRWDQVTIHQLLNNTSGISNFDQEYYSLTEPLTLEERVERFKESPLDFDPGTAWNYSNCGYALLGAIIENASHQSYGDFVKEQIFEKCEMKDSGYGDASDTGNAATGYKNNAEGSLIVVPNQKGYLQNLYAAGGLYSNGEDLKKWDSALYNDTFLTSKSKEKMFHSDDLLPHFPLDETYSLDECTLPSLFGEEKHPIMYYGYGLQVIQDPDLGLCVWHNGGIEGFRTIIIRHIETKDCIIILSNNEGVDLSEISDSIDNIFKSKEP